MNRYNRLKSRVFAALLALVTLGLFGAPQAHAQGSLPLDVSSASSTIAAYVPTAAGLGLVIAIALMGVGIIWKVFSRVGKKG